MIEKRKTVCQQAGGVRIELAIEFLNGQWGRKVYYVEEGHRFSIPSQGGAHAHGSPDFLVPIRGQIRVAYLRPSGRVEIESLEPGYYYRIPPKVPHQVEINGGILEAYFPTAVFQAGMPMKMFPRDLFQIAEEAEECSQ